MTADYHATLRIGHSGSIQTSSRLQTRVYRPGRDALSGGNGRSATRGLQHARQPVLLDRGPRDGRVRREPAAGLHFVVFNPSSDDFERNRLAMDGVLPDGTKLPFEPNSRGQGFNAVLQTTHRQNFLVPPRAHRSFPLAELSA